ncbi:MAG: helix-turn-helix domain-containing protein [Pseudonocardia sp.]
MSDGVKRNVRDARGLSCEELAQLRRSAVHAVESGGLQKDVAVEFGVSRKSVGEWVRAYRARGEESFRAEPRGRRPGVQLALAASQQQQVLRCLVTGPPDQLGLPARLWTRRSVAELVNREFGINLAASTVGRYLHRWGIDTTSDPCWASQAIACCPGPAWPPGDRVRIGWTRPRLPVDPDPANALLAVTGRGSLSFLASPRPFRVPALDELRDRLRMHLARDVRIVVCSWPPEQFAVLDSWLSAGRERATRATWN